LEYREGKGMVLFCQMDVTGRTESDPAAERLASNVLGYVSAWRPAPKRKAVYVGNLAGRRHLESAGVSLSPYKGGKPADDEVLVVAAGGGRELAEDAARVADWLAEGGHVLALGLDEQEASAFLPMKVAMRNEEHIAAYFEPFGVDSLLAGVAPADVHNPAPRELPLVCVDAAIGGGVLGKVEGANVVFCQLPPYGVGGDEGAGAEPWLSSDGTEQHNLKRTYRRTCFLLTRLLANMGVAGSTPLLERFSTPVGRSAGDFVAASGDPTKGRWLEGLYLDVPEAWDDPYRFFRW
jgi:hypothetical protein